MRRKFIAAVTSGVLALTVMAALPTHAEAVSIWLDLTPGTESVETFQYIKVISRVKIIIMW